MDGELVPAPAEVDAGTITLLDFARGSPLTNRLRRDRCHGQAVTMSLERIDLDSFTLRSRGFH